MQSSSLKFINPHRGLFKGGGLFCKKIVFQWRLIQGGTLVQRWGLIQGLMVLKTAKQKFSGHKGKTAVMQFLSFLLQFQAQPLHYSILHGVAMRKL